MTLLDLITTTVMLGILGSLSLVVFTEAEIRTKTAIAKNDLRVLAIAMESYQIDYAMYPPNSTNFRGLRRPIEYLRTAFPPDPFEPSSSYFMFNLSTWDVVANEAVSASFPGKRARQSALFERSYVLLSAGPDGRFSFEIVDGDPQDGLTYGDLLQWLRELSFPRAGIVYDPTNGTLSPGDIGRTGGGDLL